MSVLPSRLKITVPVSFGIRHLAPHWGEFLAAHPGLTMDVQLADRVVDLVEEGLDLAVRIARLPDSSLVSRKLAALAAYNESFTKQAEDYSSKAEVEILTLEQQIADKRKAIEDAKAKQTAMYQSCVAESDRLDDVLEFFSLDVPPSKLA